MFPIAESALGEHLVSESKVGTDTLFASSNSSTFQHSSSGRAWRHPDCSGWEEGSHSTQGHLPRTYL